MKKIRSCPFGYRMENGTYTVVPKERHLIEQIFTRYLDGASLQQLSIMAEETGLKFRENASSWNKNMVSRILDNSRYWDGEQYPPIVEREIATKVADLKQSKASPRSQTPFIQKRMTCPYCGSRLKRNGKKPHRTFWDCKCCQQRLGPKMKVWTMPPNVYCMSSPDWKTFIWNRWEPSERLTAIRVNG